MWSSPLPTFLCSRRDHAHRALPQAKTCMASPTLLGGKAARPQRPLPRGRRAPSLSRCVGRALAWEPSYKQLLHCGTCLTDRKHMQWDSLCFKHAGNWGSSGSLLQRAAASSPERARGFWPHPRVSQEPPAPASPSLQGTGGRHSTSAREPRGPAYLCWEPVGNPPSAQPGLAFPQLS